MAGLTNIGANSIVNTLATKSREASDSTQVISSGSRLTKASIDASSLALSEKLRTTVDVLSQANRNAANGASVIQVAIGAQQNILNLLTTMKSLTAKANDGSLSASASALINKEYQKLHLQINSIADQTRWNGSALLGGGAGSVVASGAVTLASAGLATATTNTFAAAAVNVTNSHGFITGTFKDATVVANGTSYDVTIVMANSTPGGEALQTFKATVAAPADGGSMVLTSTANAGNVLVIDYAADTAGITNATTFQDALKTVLNIGAGKVGANVVSTATADNGGVTAAGITADSSTPAGSYALTYNGTSKLMTLTAADGTKSDKLMTAAGAQSVQFDNGISVALGAGFALGTSVTQVVFDVNASSSAVAMNFQIGELSDDLITVNVSGSTTAALALNGLDVLSPSNAVLAGKALDVASNLMNSSIAELGAQQKRFESVSKNLSTAIENNVAARAVFNDADIASEMTKLTQSTVFAQLSQAMLSQSLDMQRKLVELAR